MPTTTDDQTPTPTIVIERARRSSGKPRRHYLDENPPPPLRAWTIDQIEAEHPGIKGRLRQWVARADAGDTDFRWLKLCTIRVARSVFIDEVKFRASLYEHTAMPSQSSRRAGKKAAA